MEVDWSDSGINKSAYCHQIWSCFITLVKEMTDINSPDDVTFFLSELIQVSGSYTLAN